MIVFAAAAVASWSRAWIMQADAKIDPSVGLSAIAEIGTFVGDDAPLCPRADHRHERTFGVCGCAPPPAQLHDAKTKRSRVNFCDVAAAWRIHCLHAHRAGEIFFGPFEKINRAAHRSHHAGETLRRSAA